MKLRLGLFSIFCLFYNSILLSYSHSVVKIAVYRKWSAYYYTQNDNKICYIKSRPIDRLTNHGNISKRDQFIAFSIFDKKKIEFYGNFDYGIRLSSNPILSTGNGSLYLMSPEDDYSQVAYLLDEFSEQNLVKDVIFGKYIYIFSRSIYNTYSVDMYSIDGFEEALNRIKIDCGFN